eukprot:GFUD01043423.1.p1 GENE.GFUD01043423.1~~GFUD01043423.1.p1  ORF type:complete len:322 (+),score=76.56 GFUD01043423.1:113-1078(+)
MSSAFQTEVPPGITWDCVTLPEQQLWSSVPFFHRCRSPTGSQILSLTNIGGPAILQAIHRHFHHRDSDVHVVTYPKAGTSWLQEIVWLVNHQADVEQSSLTPSGQRTVYIELIHKDGGEDDRVKSLENMASPRHVKWHHPAWLLPKKVTESGKIIYLYRNPKDTAVSWFHFQRMNKLYGFTGTFEEFLPLFMEDKVPYGSYWENLHSWWKLKDQENVLILTYESLQVDIEQGIRKIANFLEKDISDEQIGIIRRHTSFASMKANPMTNGSKIPKIEGESDFLRKGKVGDWKNYFSSEQNEKMENWIENNNQDNKIPMVFEI